MKQGINHGELESTLDCKGHSLINVGGIEFTGTAYEPALGNPFADNYVLISSAAGTRNWVQAITTLPQAGASQDGFLASVHWSLFNAKESALGNPDVNGKVLSSTTGGTRSWVAPGQPLNSNLTSWAAVTRASGFDTFVATPSSANLAALLTDEIVPVAGSKVIFSPGALNVAVNKQLIVTDNIHLISDGNATPRIFDIGAGGALSDYALVSSLGTAAFEDTGTTSGTIPVLGFGGRLGQLQGPKALYDADPLLSVDANSRQLVATDGETVVLDWSGAEVEITGSLNVTGDVKSNGIARAASGINADITQLTAAIALTAPDDQPIALRGGIHIAAGPTVLDGARVVCYPADASGNADVLLAPQGTGQVFVGAVPLGSNAFTSTAYEPALGNPAGNGYLLSSTTGGVRSWVAPSFPPFIDSTALVKGSSDATKLLRFEVDGFTTGTTRVLTAPNYNGTIATLAGFETFTNKTYEGLSIDPISDGNLTITAHLAIRSNFLVEDGHQITLHTTGLTSVTLPTSGTLLSDAVISTDGTFTSPSDTEVPSTQAVKTYVDANAGGGISSTALENEIPKVDSEGNLVSSILTEDGTYFTAQRSGSFSGIQINDDAGRVRIGDTNLGGNQTYIDVRDANGTITLNGKPILIDDATSPIIAPIDAAGYIKIKVGVADAWVPYYR